MTAFTATANGGNITLDGLWIDTFPAHDAERRVALYERKSAWPGYTQAATALRKAINATGDAGND
jgi:hypothetical protein